MTAIRKNPLSVISDSQIIKRLDSLVKKERETTLEVLQHIIEFDRRKLYLGIGYGSLYEYCTLHLKYSESAAMRRIQTARCIRDFPEVSGMLAKNELNLTNVCLLAGILTEENKNELLKEARFKSSRQVEAIVARHNPGRELRDRVRAIFVSARTEAPAKMNATHARDSENRNGRITDLRQEDSPQKNWVKFTSGAGGKNPASDAPLRPCPSGTVQAKTVVLQKKYKLEFTIETDCMKKLEEAKVILSKKYPDGVPLGKLLEESLDVLLEKHSPARKKKRQEKCRTKRKAKKNGQENNALKTKKLKTPGTTPAETIAAVRADRDGFNHGKRSRYIPLSVQDEVFARDEGKCAYVGPNGVRCNSTWNVEIDHIKPYARGGDHSVDNLRLLCARHNQYEAERIYGKEFMERRRLKAKSIRK